MASASSVTRAFLISFALSRNSKAAHQCPSITRSTLSIQRVRGAVIEAVMNSLGPLNKAIMPQARLRAIQTAIVLR